MKRTLTLHRETLVELTTDELTTVVGALALSGATCPVDVCLPTTSTKPSWWGCPTSSC